MSVRRLAVLWGPVLLQTGLLFYLSSQRMLGIHVGYADKVAHFVAYGILALFFLRALLGAALPVRLAPAALAVALTILYGVSDEVHQSFVPGRDASGYDLLADALGASFAVGLAALLLNGRKEKPNGAGSGVLVTETRGNER